MTRWSVSAGAVLCLLWGPLSGGPAPGVLPLAAQQTVKEAEKDTADKAAFTRLIRPEDEMGHQAMSGGWPRILAGLERVAGA